MIQVHTNKIKCVPRKAGQETANRRRIKRLGTATRLPNKANSEPPTAATLGSLQSEGESQLAP